MRDLHPFLPHVFFCEPSMIFELDAGPGVEMTSDNRRLVGQWVQAKVAGANARNGRREDCCELRAWTTTTSGGRLTSGDGGTQIGRTSSTTKTAMEEEEEEKRGKI
jgi:hypothetical protein